MFKNIIFLCLSFVALTGAAQAASLDIEDHIMTVQLAAQNNFGDPATLTPPQDMENLTEAECLAIAVYHEARGESIKGQLAVASVILQRAAVPNRWGDTACEVVVPVQFSFLTEDNQFATVEEERAWGQALAIGEHMVGVGPLPELQNADHYHATSVAPSWRLKMPKVDQIGDHIFYADPLSQRS